MLINQFIVFCTGGGEHRSPANKKSENKDLDNEKNTFKSTGTN